MVSAAKPAASFIVLIVFPLVVTDRSRIVLHAARSRRCCCSDDAELVAKHERGSAEQHAVVAQRAEANGDVLPDGREGPVADRLDAPRVRKRSSSRSIGPDRTIWERLSAPTSAARTMPRWRPANSR